MPETLTYSASAPPPGGPPIALDTAQPHSEAPLWAAALPLLSLLVVFGLAFSAASKPGLADTVTVGALALMAALFAYAPFLRGVREDPSSASFALCAALFVVYGLSRRVVSDDAFAVGGEVKLGMAAYAVLAGALLGAPAWLKNVNGWTRAILFALSLLALMGWLAFRFLGIYYPESSAPGVVTSTSFIITATQIVEFGALALCCTAVAANSKTRRVALLILPLLLVALAARYKTMPAAEVEE